METVGIATLMSVCWAGLATCAASQIFGDYWLPRPLRRLFGGPLGDPRLPGAIRGALPFVLVLSWLVALPWITADAITRGDYFTSVVGIVNVLFLVVWLGYLRALYTARVPK